MTSTLRPSAQSLPPCGAFGSTPQKEPSPQHLPPGVVTVLSPCSLPVGLAAALTVVGSAGQPSLRSPLPWDVWCQNVRVGIPRLLWRWDSNPGRFSLRYIFIPRQPLLIFLDPLVFLVPKEPQMEAQEAVYTDLRGTCPCHAT